MKIKIIRAHNGDSFLLSFVDDEGVKRNILIDGGMPKTYYGSGKQGELYKTIEEIRAKKEQIDLLILTHIDGDHIGGLKKWFEKDRNACDIISKVWFNSGRSIAKYFGKQENNELIEKLQIFKSLKTSVKQAIVFEDFIEKNKIWDRAIIKASSMSIQNGVEITILSPNDSSLEKLLKEYKKPKHDYRTSAKTKDWNTSIEELEFIKASSAS